MTEQYLVESHRCLLTVAKNTWRNGVEIGQQKIDSRLRCRDCREEAQPWGERLLANCLLVPRIRFSRKR